jgi:hypothetical protein
MLGRRDLHQRQVEDLAALHPGNRPPRQASPAAAAAGRLMAHLPVWPGHLCQRAALMPSCPPGVRPLFFGSDRGLGGGLSSPSLDGGLDEFRGVCLSRASSSAICSRASASSRSARASAACDSASSPRSAATSAASTSSLEPASSPGTPGRYYHPRSPTRRSRIIAVPLDFRGFGAGGAWRVSGNGRGRRGAGIWRGSDTPDRQTGDRAVGQPDQPRHTPRGRVWVTG